MTSGQECPPYAPAQPRPISLASFHSSLSAILKRVKEPLPEYEARRSAWVAKQNVLEREFQRLGNARLALAVATALVAWLTYGPVGISGWWILVPVSLIVALFAQNAQVTRRRDFAERGIRYYDRAIDRVKNQWQGKGEPGERFRDANHVYAEDLDIFGNGSAFELLCTARTAAGEDTLAAWLLHPASAEEAAARQEGVRELRDRLDLREGMALLGEDVRAQVRADVITRWGATPPILFPSLLQPLAFVFSIIAFVVSIAFVLQRVPLWALAASLLINGAIVFFTRPIVSQIVSSIETPASHLAILALLIQRIEQEKFQSPLLQQWIRQLSAGGLPAASQIRRLEGLIDWLGSGSHPIVKVIQLALLWPLQVALRIELWRRQSGSHIGDWINALAGFEALAALASLTFERPSWTFPVLLSPAAQASFNATALRHPLIAEQRSIANDVNLNGTPRLLIVSGSNMSGKSTLLRTIGLNTVLA